MNSTRPFCLWVNRRVCSAVITSVVKKSCQKALTCCGIHAKCVAYVLKISSRETYTHIYTHRHIHTLTHKRVHSNRRVNKCTKIKHTHTHKQPYIATHTSARIYNHPCRSIIYVRVCLLLCHRLFGWLKPIARTCVCDCTCILQQR